MKMDLNRKTDSETKTYKETKRHSETNMSAEFNPDARIGSKLLDAAGKVIDTVSQKDKPYDHDSRISEKK